MKKLVKKILVGVNSLFALLLLLSYLATVISPEYLWQIAYLGLIYPYILIINVGFCILWVIKFKKYIFISLVTILLGYNQLGRIYQLNADNTPQTGTKSENELKVLSYNVRLFDYYNWSGEYNTKDKILKFVESQEADIICFQEYMTQQGAHKKEIDQRLEKYKYSYKNYTIEYKLNIGLAVYSKHPIIGHGFIQFPNSINQAVYADILYGPDTVRIYNTHLQSVGFAGKNYSVIDSLKLEYDEKQIEELMDISKLLKNAYIIRADQANTLSNHIRSSPHHKIVCGDFNDPPVSYTYRKIRNGLKDSFVQAGSGIDFTYKRGVSAFRIDYILFSDYFKAVNHNRIKVPYSDHYPVVTTLVRN